MSAAGLHDLRVAMVRADSDSIFECYLTVKQAASREPSPGCRKILEAMAAALDSAYSEKEKAA